MSELLSVPSSSETSLVVLQGVVAGFVFLFKLQLCSSLMAQESLADVTHQVSDTAAELSQPAHAEREE